MHSKSQSCASRQPTLNSNYHNKQQPFSFAAVEYLSVILGTLKHRTVQTIAHAWHMQVAVVEPLVDQYYRATLC